MLLLTAASAVVNGAARADDCVTVIAPEAIAYQQDPRVPGAAVAIVAGDPEAGFYTMRVKLAAGTKVPAHYHPDGRTVTVLSGSYYFAEGAAFDASAMQAHMPGTVIVVPAGKPHYVWAKDGEVIIQEAGPGPTGMTFMDP